MTANTVFVGSAEAVRRLVAGARVDATSAAVTGFGDVPLPVFARANSLEQLNIEALRAAHLVLAEPIAPDDARALLERAADVGATISLAEGDRVRALELSDLVGAPLAEADGLAIRKVIAGKRVLITGGGGSIGGELARHIAAMAPARLTLLDSSECNLFKMGLDVPSATLALADIRDARSMRRWFDREKPDLVFHAAALKQVPLVEAFASEGVLTNVAGLRNVAEAALAVGADMIFVSTDKAVDPSGVMGASKRLGEMYCQALDRRGDTRVVPVRLGNVLSSAGSVAPIFAAQLAAGRPLTVTDAEVTRFFLSIPQSADALLRAAAAALRDDVPRGTALVIDMGEALPVVELARAVIRLAGLRPNIDHDIVFTGLRPGEKLHERLIGVDENVTADAAEGVSAVASAPRGLSELHAIIERLTLLAREGADAAISEDLFAAIVTEAAPQIRRAIAD